MWHVACCTCGCVRAEGVATLAIVSMMRSLSLPLSLSVFVVMTNAEIYGRETLFSLFFLCCLMFHQ